jgi:RhtB (resistance to homoserine/threonine) family protein
MAPMSDMWAVLLLAYLVNLGAVISPGPDFLIVLRNTLGQSARAGIFTALGITVALSVHMTYCLAGIGLLIAHSIILFNVIKWVGAAYLVYVGWQALQSKGMALDDSGPAVSSARKSDRQAFVSGFVTNLFNPKCTLFLLALFTQMIDPAMPLAVRAAFCGACMLTAFAWFSLVSVVMGVPRVRAAYARASRGIDRVFGGFFIALGAKLALARLS